VETLVDTRQIQERVRARATALACALRTLMRAVRAQSCCSYGSDGTATGRSLPSGAVRSPHGPRAARMRTHNQPRHGPSCGSFSGSSRFLGSKCSLPGAHLVPQKQKPPSRGIGGHRPSTASIANAPAARSPASKVRWATATGSFAPRPGTPVGTGGTSNGSAPRHTGPPSCAREPPAPADVPRALPPAALRPRPRVASAAAAAASGFNIGTTAGRAAAG
jgi:hypothetical protein